MQVTVLFVVLALIATLTQGQLPIPTRELGFVYKKGEADAEIKVAAYLDLACAYSRDSFLTLLSLAKQYKPNQLQLKIRLFPLPYHRNSYTMSLAAHVLNRYKSAKNATVYDWIQAVYGNMDSLTNKATADKNDFAVLSFLSSLAHNVTGISSGEFKTGLDDQYNILAARLEFKYVCSRGVYSTPSFTVNDVFVNADSSWTVNQWSDLINGI